VSEGRREELLRQNQSSARAEDEDSTMAQKWIIDRQKQRIRIQIDVVKIENENDSWYSFTKRGGEI